MGVREQSGVLEQIVRNIEHSLRSRDIPEALEADVTNLEVHDVLHVSDIPTPAGVEILAARTWSSLP